MADRPWHGELTPGATVHLPRDGGVAWGSRDVIMRETCGRSFLLVETLFPGARSDASVWGPGCLGVATGVRICWCTAGQCPHQALRWGYRDCHIAIICRAGLSESEVTPLRGHRQWCKLVETRTSLSNACVCVLRPTQRCTPDNRRHPPTSPCSFKDDVSVRPMPMQRMAPLTKR